MYNAQIIRERIKEQQKIKNIKNADDMMNELDLGVNIIRQMSDKKGVGCFALAKIADYLDCSTDYLLGRVDTPNATYSITGDNNVQVNGNNGNNSPLTVNSKDYDEATKELVQLVQSLSLVKKAEAILYLNELKSKK